MGFALSDMRLTSPAFAPGGAIPKRYTGEGEDIPPPLQMAAVPAAARSLAIFCHDPDAPLVVPHRYGFVHWLVYNLPPDLRQLDQASTAGTAGSTDFGRNGYGGPMPPQGHGEHRYYFWLLALDCAPDLPPDMDLCSFLTRVEPRVIAMNRLTGTYQRD